MYCLLLTIDMRNKSDDVICCKYSGFLCRILFVYIIPIINVEGATQACLKQRFKMHDLQLISGPKFHDFSIILIHI